MGCKLTKRTSSKVGAIDAWRGAHYQPLITSKISRKLKCSVGRKDARKSENFDPPITFSEFSTTSATYVKSASHASKITLRLSCDGSTLEIEQCDMEYTVNETSVDSVSSQNGSETDLCEKVYRSYSVPTLPAKHLFGVSAPGKHDGGDDYETDSLTETFEIHLDDKNISLLANHNPDSNTSSKQLDFECKILQNEGHHREYDDSKTTILKRKTTKSETRKRSVTFESEKGNSGQELKSPEIDVILPKTAVTMDANKADVLNCLTNTTSPEARVIDCSKSVRDSPSRGSISNEEVRRKSEFNDGKNYYEQMACRSSALRFSDMAANSLPCQPPSDRLLKSQCCNEPVNDNNILHRGRVEATGCPTRYPCTEERMCYFEPHCNNQENCSIDNLVHRRLYNDRSLSFGGKKNCAKCHIGDEENVSLKGHTDPDLSNESEMAPLYPIISRKNYYDRCKGFSECCMQNKWVSPHSNLFLNQNSALYRRCEAIEAITNDPRLSCSVNAVDINSFGAKYSEFNNHGISDININGSSNYDDQKSNFDSYINFIRRKGEGAIPKRRLLNLYQNYTFSPLPGCTGVKRTTTRNSPNKCIRSTSVHTPLNIRGAEQNQPRFNLYESRECVLSDHDLENGHFLVNKRVRNDCSFQNGSHFKSNQDPSRRDDEICVGCDYGVCNGGTINMEIPSRATFLSNCTDEVKRNSCGNIGDPSGGRFEKNISPVNVYIYPVNVNENSNCSLNDCGYSRSRSLEFETDTKNYCICKIETRKKLDDSCEVDCTIRKSRCSQCELNSCSLEKEDFREVAVCCCGCKCLRDTSSRISDRSSPKTIIDRKKQIECICSQTCAIKSYNKKDPHFYLHAQDSLGIQTMPARNMD